MPERDAVRRRITRDFVLMFGTFTVFVFALAANIKPGHVDFTPAVVVAVLVACACAAGVAVSPKLVRLRRLNDGAPRS